MRLRLTPRSKHLWGQFDGCPSCYGIAICGGVERIVGILAKAQVHQAVIGALEGIYPHFTRIFSRGAPGGNTALRITLLKSMGVLPACAETFSQMHHDTLLPFGNGIIMIIIVETANAGGLSQCIFPVCHSYAASLSPSGRSLSTQLPAAS